LPPLRTEENRQQLVDAFNKGEISLIASNHRPRSFEEKEEPFGISAFGATGIQETFSALVSLCDRLDTHQLIKSLSEKAYDAIGMPIPAIQEEHLACLTVFDLTAPSTWLGQSQSLSNNSPIPQKQLQGKVIGVIHQSKAFWS
jgi:dihydroorotase